MQTQTKFSDKKLENQKNNKTQKLINTVCSFIYFFKKNSYNLKPKKNLIKQKQTKKKTKTTLTKTKT